jgi:hypothetical protein
MTLGEKLSFLRGLNEGISESAGPLDIFFVSSERPSERVGALDHVFAEPENILIPIRSALRWHVKKLKGASQSEVDGDLSALREWALAAPENK